MSAAAPTCPVCRAAYRGSATCSRCRADLSWPMAMAHTAWRLRSDGWAALLRGDCLTATALAAAAQQLQDTPSARRLAWLAQVVGARAD